jgi:hypothetical protein
LDGVIAPGELLERLIAMPVHADDERPVDQPGQRSKSQLIRGLKWSPQETSSATRAESSFPSTTARIIPSEEDPGSTELVAHSFRAWIGTPAIPPASERIRPATLPEQVSRDFDLSSLSDAISRILNEDARRHGIGL